MNFSRKRSVIHDINSSIKSSVNHEHVSKRILRKEFEMDKKIKNLANEIKQRLAEGKKPEQISIIDKTDINEIISFILDKSALYVDYLLILNHFLYTFNFLEIYSLPECFINKNDLFNKICLTLKKENIIGNKIIYLNGQLGRKFYIILEGKVTILEPVEFKVKATYQQFYEYMEFLLSNNEYELIRLCFNSNQKKVNEKIKIFKNNYYKFYQLLDHNLNSDFKQESVDEKGYVEKFNFFINETFGEKSILNDAEKKIQEEIERKQEEEEKKEKEKEVEELKMEDEINRRIITGNDAENDRYEIIDKIKSKKRESIDHFYNQRKHKKIKDLPKIFVLWKYNNKNIILKNGDSFGETTLKKNDNKLKSTIITKTECLFCILERDEYRNLISEYMDNARKINVDSLMHSKLFHNYNSDLFGIHYYNYFTPIKKSKGDYIFRQKEIRKNIYFIKSGGVQIEYYSSWNDLVIILDILTEQNPKIKKAFIDMIIPHDSFENFTQKKQKFNIFNYFNGEIVGTNEILYPDTNIFMFDAVCTSDCEIFSLDMESLNNIIYEKIIRKNYNELNILKREKLIKRLLSLKSSVIFQFNRLVESEDKQQITEKTVKKNNSILIDKTRNKFSLKNNVVFSTPEIRKEIINYSPEKKNKTKEYHLFKLKNSETLTFKSTKKFSNNIALFNTNNNNKIKLLETRKSTSDYVKTEKIEIKKSPKRKIKINFSLKGKVPKLLLNKANTVNKVLDQLLLKEKDLCNVNNSSYSKNYSKYFINHLDILSFDSFMNKIETNLKTNREENTKERQKKIKKLILMPVSLKRGQNRKFSKEKKINFRKDIVP